MDETATETTERSTMEGTAAGATPQRTSSETKIDVSDPDKQAIIRAQTFIPEVKPSYLQLYCYAKPFEWILMVLGIFFAIISGASLPGSTVLLGQMVDSFSSYQRGLMTMDDFQHEVNRQSLYFVLLGVIIFTTTYIYMSSWVYTGEILTRQIREHYLRAVLRQNVAYFDVLGAGEFVTRISSDTHLIQDGISEKVPLSTSYVSQFLSAFVIGFIKSWRLTLVIGSVIPIIVLSTGIMNRYNSVFVKSSLDSYSYAGVIAEEAISTIRTAVAFGNQARLSKLYDSYLNKAKKEGVKKAVLTAAGLGVVFFTIYCAYSLAFYYGSRLLIQGEVTSGTIVNVFFAVIIGSFALGNLAPDLQAFSSAVGAGAKIFETINREPPIDSASDAGLKPKTVDGHIQLHNVSFVYPARPEVRALNDVSIDIEPGTTVALVGESGSGKSTIVSLVLRFYDPVGGMVTFDGHDVRDLNIKWLRRNMGLVSQEPVLFNTTIYGNVTHGLVGSSYERASEEKKRELVEQACKMANAHDFIMKLPEKYETNVGERGFLLSGGQKQRIAIARAIIKDPPILLLDEATSALDTKSEAIVQDALDKASRDRTTIVIAHRLSTIRNATKIIVMGKGVILESGTHDELIAKQGAYAKLVEAQRIAAANSEEQELSFIPPEDQNMNIEVVEDSDGKRVVPARTVSVSSDVIKKRNADLEANTKRENDYRAWELMRKISRINRPEVVMIVFGLFASMVSGIVFPIFSIIFSKILQTFTKTDPEEIKSDSDFWSLMFFVIALVTFASYFSQNLAFGYAGERLTRRIRSMSFAAILRQDVAFFDEERHNVGTLTSALSLDATQVKGIAGVSMGTILQVSTTILGGLIVAFVVGWKLTLVCICCIPLLIGSGTLRMRMLNGFQAKTKKSYEESAQVACEGAANIRTIASLTREEDLWQIYHHKLDEPLRQGKKNAFIASIVFAVAQCIMFLVDALAFWYGSRLFINGEYDVEQMFTVFMAIIFGSISAGRVFAFAPDIARAKSSAASIMSLLERKPTIDAWSNSGTKLDHVNGRLRFTDVHFRYPTRPHVSVLKGLNLEVKPGQYAALVGPSGCGKSTTVGLIERFYDITSGKIELDGVDISSMNVSNLRLHMALVSQEPSLYDMTIRENIIFGAKPGVILSQEEVERACREANIHDFIDSLPDKYNTRVGGKGTQLSGGQKQRIAIARALARNPRILLLDEATSALDSESEQVVQQALDAAARGRTTISIAHRLSSIQHADVIFVIKDGVVHEQGTHQELLANKGMYFEMVQEQSLEGNGGATT